jgi:HAD superfamily hydrolase (TIGR01459 family)
MTSFSDSRAIDGLADIADRYDAVLCDVWGVIHNGRESFGPACEALIRFQEQHGPVVLISNAPRPAVAVHDQLDSLGVPRAAWGGFVSSGDATRAILAARAPGPVFALGPDRDAPLYDGLGLEFAPLEEAAFIACTGLIDDTNETPEDYRSRLTDAARRRLPFVCANPDRVVQRGDRLIPCAGALADLYAELGGEVIMVGKPFAPTYDLAVAEAARLAGRPLDRARILCIGDGVGTDVKGAEDQGLDCLFVTGGIHVGEGDADEILAAAGTRAAYSLAALAWDGQNHVTPGATR